MLRTYGRRRRRRSHETDDTPLRDPSPPRKRPKVFVEIVSPKAKKSQPETTPLKRGSVVKRMLGRSRTESSLEATPLATLSASTAMARCASSHSLPTTFPDTEITPEASTRSSPKTLPTRNVRTFVRETSSAGTPVARRTSSHSLPTTFLETEVTPEVSIQSSPKALPTRNVRTYAESSRSFLVALPVPDATDPLNAVQDDTQPHESYADLRTRWGIDISEDDAHPYEDEPPAEPSPLRRTTSELSQPSHPTGMMNDLKSITELRSKGESRRFLDEVGYLFESLDSSSAIGLRRASAFEIVNKLCDLDFNRRARTSDFYIRTWDKIWAARAGTSDKILDATIAFFAALATRDPRTLMDLAQQEEFVPALVEILSTFDHEKDVLAFVLAAGFDDDLKSYGILRTETTAIKSLARLVLKESRASSFDQPSARFFVSHSLATLPPSFLAARYLPTLLVNLRAELALLEPRITAYQSGLPLLPPNGVNPVELPSFYHIEACLRLLDSYLLGHWSPAVSGSSDGLSHLSGFTSELISLCIASTSFLKDGEEGTVIARRCLCGAIRVLTLLSHDAPWWCAAALKVPYALQFATMTVMRSQAKWSERCTMESANGSIEAFDLLCLALGLVMNWATLSPEVAVRSRITSINPLCPGSYLCVRACQCENQKLVLECLVALHVQYCDDGKEDSPECAFLRGYTAILLGLLVKDDPTNQTIVMSTLPGASPSDKIKSLISNCRSFLDFYTDTVPLSSSDSPRATPEEAAQGSSSRHRATWDKGGEQVARSVIASLEILCSA